MQNPVDAPVAGTGQSMALVLYRRMLEEGRRRPDRVWAVEGCNGVGKHLAQRLVADGEPVLDVPVPGWQGDDMSPVIIGVDPHKRSATIEIVDSRRCRRRNVLGRGCVPDRARLAARARVFDTGHGRKTDATDARSVALVALRTTGLHRVSPGDHTVALRLLVDRRGRRGGQRYFELSKPLLSHNPAAVSDGTHTMSGATP